MFFDIFRQIRIGKIKPVCQIVQADLALIIRLNIILDLLDPDSVLRIFHMKSRVVRFHKKITCQDIKWEEMKQVYKKAINLGSIF